MAEEEGKDGGYDCDLIEEPPDDLICPICLLPPRKPHLISCCGRKLCHSCVDRVKQAGQPCPCCREEEYIIVKDKMVERQVLDLKVYCKNKSKGCHWSGELRDLEKHTESCYVTSAELLAETQAEEIKKLKKELDDVTSHLQQIQVLSDRKEDELIAAQNTIKQLKEENETLQAEKNEVFEHQKEEIETLKEENRKQQDKVEGLSRQETAMKKRNDNLHVENQRLKRQLKEMKQSPQFTPPNAPPPPPPPFGPGYPPPQSMPLYEPYHPQRGAFRPQYRPRGPPPHDMYRPPHDMHHPQYHKHRQQFN
uniref:RING-type domain-containing protein n=1 Tax=Amphimedon queenslandica TaxID=400682 RepID=A0A1X7TZF9_AMPQE